MWWHRLRLGNLAMMAGLVVLIYSQLIGESNGFPYILMSLHVLTICLIAGGAYLHNDLVDQVSDRINRGVAEDPKLTQKLVRVSSVMTSTGVAVSVLHGMLSGSYLFGALTIMVAILLYCYSRWLQGMILWGNLTVAMACALVILSIPLAQADLWSLDIILTGLALFAFLTTLARELIKDLQDVEGDRVAGQRTLAIVRPDMSRLLALICMILTAGLLIWSLFLLPGQQTTGSKIVTGVLLVLSLLLSLRIKSTTEVIGFKLLSLWLKMFMLLGMTLLFFYQLN